MTSISINVASDDALAHKTLFLKNDPLPQERVNEILQNVTDCARTALLQLCTAGDMTKISTESNGKGQSPTSLKLDNPN